MEYNFLSTYLDKKDNFRNYTRFVRYNVVEKGDIFFSVEEFAYSIIEGILDDGTIKNLAEDIFNNKTFLAKIGI